MSAFKNFKRELKLHSAAGYHAPLGPIERISLHKWFLQRKWAPPADYLDYMATVGPGKYFDGSLVIFPLEGSDLSLTACTNKILSEGVTTLLGFGYDGTTNGCYCVSNSGSDGKVYWFEWEEGTFRVVNDDFADWIESLDEELFDKKIYAGFKSIKDIQSIRHVIEQRKSFKVRVMTFDVDLVRPPGQEGDFLPRYHRVIFGVSKLSSVSLQKITVLVSREGSTVGLKNVTHIVLDVSGVPLNKEVLIECYVFDPYNRPFENIVCAYDPNIDLNSKSRIQFKEIEPYL